MGGVTKSQGTLPIRLATDIHHLFCHVFSGSQLRLRYYDAGGFDNRWMISCQGQICFWALLWQSLIWGGHHSHGICSLRLQEIWTIYLNGSPPPPSKISLVLNYVWENVAEVHQVCWEFRHVKVEVVLWRDSHLYSLSPYLPTWCIVSD